MYQFLKVAGMLTFLGLPGVLFMYAFGVMLIGVGVFR